MEKFYKFYCERANDKIKYSDYWIFKNKTNEE